jgi:hypothetical protein
VYLLQDYTDFHENALVSKVRDIDITAFAELQDFRQKLEKIKR